MEAVQYRIRTVTFAEECPATWRTRSSQMLEHLARWAGEGWRINKLNTSAHIRLGARGLCIILERPLREISKKGASRSRGQRSRECAA
jgi:hypothetical protein